MTLHVREPEPWVPGTTSHSGLAISVDPLDPSLDTFWEGGVGVSVLGPAGRHVTCTISLTSASGKELLSDEIGSFELPVTTAEWTKKFSQFAKDEGSRVDLSGGSLRPVPNQGRRTRRICASAGEGC